MPLSDHKPRFTITDHFLYSNLWIACGAFFLTAGFCALFSYPDRWLYASFSAFGTLSIYTFQRLVKSIKSVSGSQEQILWYMRYKIRVIVLIVFSSIICLATFLLVVSHWQNILLLVSVLALISVFYVLRNVVAPFREIPHVKIHLVALVWVGICAIFPMLNENRFEINHFCFALAHYFYFIAITIPFDIRDVLIDEAGMKTIPQVAGVKRAILISLTAFVLFVIALHFSGILNLWDWKFAFVVIYHLSLLLLSSENRSKAFTLFFIDGGIILLGLAYLYATP